MTHGKKFLVLVQSYVEPRYIFVILVVLGLLIEHMSRLDFKKLTLETVVIGRNSSQLD